MSLIDTTLFKTLVYIEATRIFPFHKKGRPPKLTNEEAFDCILKVVRTGMQWRSLDPSPFIPRVRSIGHNKKAL